MARNGVFEPLTEIERVDCRDNAGYVYREGIVFVSSSFLDRISKRRFRDYQGQAYSFEQTLDDGHECWKLRPLQGGNSDSTLAPAEVRPIFMAVVLDCLV